MSVFIWPWPWSNDLDTCIWSRCICILKMKFLSVAVQNLQPKKTDIDRQTGLELLPVRMVQIRYWQMWYSCVELNTRNTRLVVSLYLNVYMSRNVSVFQWKELSKFLSYFYLHQVRNTISDSELLTAIKLLRFQDLRSNYEFISKVVPLL